MKRPRLPKGWKRVPTHGPCEIARWEHARFRLGANLTTGGDACIFDLDDGTRYGMTVYLMPVVLAAWERHWARSRK